MHLVSGSDLEKWNAQRFADRRPDRDGAHGRLFAVSSLMLDVATRVRRGLARRLQKPSGSTVPDATESFRASSLGLQIIHVRILARRFLPGEGIWRACAVSRVRVRAQEHFGRSFRLSTTSVQDTLRRGSSDLLNDFDVPRVCQVVARTDRQDDLLNRLRVFLVCVSPLDTLEFTREGMIAKHVTNPS
jgi:hypothetical protein